MRALTVLAAWLALGVHPAGALSMDWVAVGDPGNACDTQASGCFGAVTTPYQIGRYEVTNAQYAEFLNAVDPTGADALALYNPGMGSSEHGGIERVSGNADGSKYVLKTSMDAKPVNFVSWFDALRFANWMHNGMGSGGTESGAYTLLGGIPIPSNSTTITRNAGATVWLPSEDEWYKAAYYGGASGTWLDYPAGEDTTIGCSAPTAAPNTANCDFAAATLTDVGSYTGSASPYGTFDQGGNVLEWNEEPFFDGSFRGIRGGSWFDFPGALAASFRDPSLPQIEDNFFGFRVASVPEPSTGLLVMAGVLAVAWARSARSG